MSAPIRIQCKRTKGWRMPEGCVSVMRPSIWGNPFIVGQPSGIFDDGLPSPLIAALTLEQCISFYRDLLSGFLSPEMFPHGHQWMERFRKSTGGHPSEIARSFLRGKSLACACPLDQPCHADILLEIANA